jgi:very-short-patch-repair endonuclease
MAPSGGAREPKPAGSGPVRGIEHDRRAASPEPGDLRPIWVPEHVRGRGEREAERLADLQAGLLTRDQLRAAGFGRGAIRHRLTNGRLHPYHPGVYLLGRPSREPLADEMAAVLLFKGFAVLSHRSAGALLGLSGRPDSVTLTIVGKDARSRPGLTIHRATRLDPRDIRTTHGLPHTSPARTLVDLAGETTDDELAEASAWVLHRHRTSRREITGAIDRAPHHKGTATLRAVLGADTGYTEAAGERALLALLRQAGLPLPATQVPICGYRVDFLWPGHQLVVEIDGFEFHGDRAAFERDRERDQVLAAAGYRVIRITYRQLEERPYALVARLAQLLGPRP